MLQRWLPVAIWIGVILGLSSIPSRDSSGPPFPGSDKLAHMVVYGVLGWLLSRARGLRRKLASRASVVVVATLVGLGVGAVDESYQRSIPGRVSDVLDWIADGAGAALGGWLYWWRRRADTPSQAEASQQQLRRE